MSEYKVVEVDFKEEKILLDSLIEMGYQPSVSDVARPLEGYQGDQREQKAHIIIPRKQIGGASNDVGFERTKNGGFTLHASQYDSAWRDGHKVKKLKQTYSEKIVMRQINRTSQFSVVSREEKQGSIRIRIKSMY